MITATCIYCKRAFDAERKSAKYCSPNCRVKFHNPPKEKEPIKLLTPDPQFNNLDFGPIQPLKTIQSEESTTIAALKKRILELEQALEKAGAKSNKLTPTTETKPYNPFDNPRFTNKMGTGK